MNPSPSPTDQRPSHANVKCRETKKKFRVQAEEFRGIANCGSRPAQPRLIIDDQDLDESTHDLLLLQQTPMLSPNQPRGRFWQTESDDCDQDNK